MRPRLGPLRPLRRARDSRLMQRRAEAGLHEFVLVFLGLSDLDHDPSAAIGGPSQVGMEAGGPIALTRVHVDPQHVVDPIVSIGTEPLELEDEDFSHYSLPQVSRPIDGAPESCQSQMVPYKMSMASPNSCQR